MLHSYPLHKYICYWYLLGLCILPSVALQGARTRANTTSSYRPLKKMESETSRSVSKELKILQKAFGTPKGFDSLTGTPITLDYQHVFGMNFDFTNNKTVTLDGFHHDNKKQVESAGVIKFSIKRKNRYGYYRAKLLYQGKHLGTKNFFPACWSRVKVVSKIREAYNNALKHRSGIQKRSDGSFEIQGTTQEGITIKMFMNRRGLIFTAYPLKI